MTSLVTNWIRITPGTEDRDNIIAALWVDDHAELFEGRQQHGEIYIPIGGPCIELSVDEMANIPNVLPLPPAPEVKALVEAAQAATEYMLDAELCDADREWQIGNELRAALAPFRDGEPPAEVAGR